MKIKTFITCFFILAIGCSVKTPKSGSIFKAAAISAGSGHTCAVTQEGKVLCWGDNTYCQLGAADVWWPNQTTTPVESGNMGKMISVSTVSSGGVHTCVLTDTGGVKCWGNPDDGLLGDGKTSWMGIPDGECNAVDVLGLSTGIKRLSAGGGSTLVVTSEGKAESWGYSMSGTSITIPTDVAGLTNNVIDVSADKCFYIGWALTTKGGVEWWYVNTVMGVSPTEVSGLGCNVEKISSGCFYLCALLIGGNVKCVGFNNYGQLGNEITTPTPIVPALQFTMSAVDVVGLPDGIIEITAGGSHSCALDSTGGVWCWGKGYGIPPVMIEGLSNDIVAISAGGSHTCAMTSAGGIKCWGDNTYGQLGDGTFTSSNTPVDVIGFYPVPYRTGCTSPKNCP